MIHYEFCNICLEKDFLKFLIAWEYTLFRLLQNKISYKWNKKFLHVFKLKSKKSKTASERDMATYNYLLIDH